MSVLDVINPVDLSTKDFLINQQTHKIELVKNRVFVNVEDFGAKHDGGFDDSPAIQAAINYARSFSTPGNYRKVVYFPTGYYTLYSAIDCTATNGLVLRGEGGRYINTVLTGNTGAIGLDFTGSSYSGCEDLMFTSPNGLPNPSIVGIQFALSKTAVNQATPGNQEGGLNCYLNNVSIFMGNFVSVNAGMGSIGILNSRSEQIGLHNVSIQANTCAVFATQNNLQPLTGYNYTVLSTFKTIQDGPNGSMGGINWTGDTSLKVFEHNTPALLLDGVNDFNFHGYIGRISNSTNGTYETAIRCVNQIYGMKVHTTIESFSQVIRFDGISENVDINATIANQANSMADVVYVNQQLNGSVIKVGFGNTSEFNNGRKFLNGPATSYIYNSEITSTKWIDNTLFVPQKMLKNSQNVIFNTGQPFERKGIYVRDLKSYFKGINPGTTNGGSQTAIGSVIRFTDVPVSEGGGFYQAKVKGIVQLGNFGTGGINGICAVSFEGNVIVTRKVDGTYAAQQSSITILGKSNVRPAYMDVATNGINLSFALTGTINSVLITVNIEGISNAEGIAIYAQTELSSNFQFSSPVLLD